MESEQSVIQNEPRRGFSRLFKACLFLFIFVVIVFAGMVIYVMRTPEMQKLSRCQINMVEIRQAINRYRDVTGKYPPDLNAIKKDYLKDPSILNCPQDKSDREKPSFIYNRPKPGSPDDFPMLIFEVQKFFPDIPIKRIVLPKSGNVKTEPISLQKAINEANQQQKQKPK